MWIHYAYATAARDAVISGHLDQVRSPLRSLASSQPSAELPNDWRPWLQDMQAVARTGSEATSLAQAARSVAALASACGECHRTTRGGRGDASRAARVYDPQDKQGLAEKMARHKFSADALWLGLTGPEHQAWATGAAALMNIHVPSLVDEHGTPAAAEQRPSGEGTLQGAADPRLPSQDSQDSQDANPAAPGATDLDAALRELRELGKRADDARSALEKQAVFAQLITRCGSCHAALGVRLPAEAMLGGSPVGAHTAAAAPKRVVISADKIVITEKIQFDFDTATIKPESYGLLDEIAAVIKANPQLRKISIEGHTDSEGEASYNLKLSRERAAAVELYLVEHGAAAERLSSSGLGEERPIASNDSPEGREDNRRVEFMITEQDMIKRTYELDPATGTNREVDRSQQP